jgi:hypothetical protein
MASCDKHKALTVLSFESIQCIVDVLGIRHVGPL